MEQSPHQKLESEEIKQLICDITLDLYEMRDTFLDQYELIDDSLEKLKRHFCPEKFQIAHISGETLSELIMSTYGNINVCETSILNRQENKDDMEETDQI